MPCAICKGIGWVCENHPDKAWDKQLGCECGAGMPCRCNKKREPGIDESDIPEVLTDERDTKPPH